MHKKYLQNITLLPLLLGCLLLTSGCGSKIKYGAANIVSTPAGAEVVNLKDSSNLGITPVHVSFRGEADTSEFITIQVRKVGYRDRITAFWINKRHDSEEKAEEDAVDIQVELEKREK
ncbi:MAG: hypothetical protein ACN4GW_06195 [Desulforhopalus sp.]